MSEVEERERAKEALTLCLRARLIGPLGKLFVCMSARVSGEMCLPGCVHCMCV